MCACNILYTRAAASLLTFTSAQAKGKPSGGTQQPPFAPSTPRRSSLDPPSSAGQRESLSGDRGGLGGSPLSSLVGNLSAAVEAVAERGLNIAGLVIKHALGFCMLQTITMYLLTAVSSSACCRCRPCQQV